MHRYFIVALLGGLAGLILDAVVILMHASYPDLPRPISYSSGSGALVIAIFTFFSITVWSMNTRCFFLCAACVLNPSNLVSFLMSGILPVVLCKLLRSIWRRVLCPATFVLYVMMILMCSSLLCAYWPDLVDPVAANTARIMHYNEGWGLTICGTSADCSGFEYLTTDLALVYFVAYLWLDTCRCVLTKHVFVPMGSSFANRPTYYEFAKACILLFLILGVNLSIAEAFGERYRWIFASS